ncbi:MAG: V-type ATP synthase subunit D [Planctomycetota bacterium]|nr:V-type ATP synthase subunit D [Planctomycetota bacterium]
MAKKIKLTRPELKRQREALGRYERFLPTLKLKQQQLQLAMRKVRHECSQARAAADEAQGRFDLYKAVLADLAGLDVRALAEPEEVKTSLTNIAGVKLPVFEEVVFPTAKYSLFGTPAWVDKALADLRELHRCLAMLKVLRQQYDLLDKELTKIIQRVNLFEKVKIPDSRTAIRKIRIHLGDVMTAGIARAKITKAKLDQIESAAVRGDRTMQEQAV